MQRADPRATRGAVTSVETFTFRTAYGDDRRARAELERFLHAMHGLDLTRWEEAGYWDERYQPFSLFDGDRIVASACMYSMDLVLEGRRVKVAQLSGVGTVPELRRRGLNRGLTERIVAEAAATGHEGLFLFANREAFPYYASCGFRAVEERAPTLAVGDVAPRSGLRRLDMADARDRLRLHAAALERVPVSERLGALGAKLLMFHALYALRDDVYEIPDLGAIVLFRIADGRLTLFDVVARELPSFAALHPCLAIRPHREVRFEFEPDRLGVEPTGRVLLPEAGAHVLPPFSLARAPFVFPCTARA